MDTPTTYADLTAAGWTPGGYGAAGYLFRSIKIGPYEITAYANGAGVSLERRDGAITIPEADTVALATKIAALLRGETSADTALTEAHTTNLRLAGELAQAQAEREAAREEIAQAERVLTDAGVWHPGSITEQIGTLVADIKAARAENAALRARLAERPTPSDPRDPPVTTAEEEAIERLWDALFNKGGGIERDDFATAASGDPAGELLDLADAVESALDKANEQIRTLTEERDHAINIATEQFRHRLHRT